MSEGSPTNHVRLWRYNVAQEQATTNWASASPGALLAPTSQGVTVQPTARFRFVDFAGSGAQLVYSSGNSTTFPFVDCEFHSGSIYNNASDFYATNCLFEAVSASHSDDTRAIKLAFQNCSFYRGELNLEHLDAGAWRFRDNLFYNASNSVPYDPVDADYNAFPTNATTLATAGGTHDLILTNPIPVFQTGPFGRFYLPAGSQLADRGSTNAGAISLYWYTTVTNASICESNSTVDIGFHAVGTDPNGLPRDEDGDGLFNVSEDKNGNGVRDSGETAFLSSGTDQDSDGDGVSDFIETLLGRNPLVAGSTNDASGTLNLRVFTPLK
jgi:hypothetical protein